MDDFLVGAGLAAVCTNLIWSFWFAPSHFRDGCLAADASRVVLEVNGKQRCLTQEQAKAIK